MLCQYVTQCWWVTSFLLKWVDYSVLDWGSVLLGLGFILIMGHCEIAEIIKTMQRCCSWWLSDRLRDERFVSLSSVHGMSVWLVLSIRRLAKAYRIGVIPYVWSSKQRSQSYWTWRRILLLELHWDYTVLSSLILSLIFFCMLCTTYLLYYLDAFRRRATGSRLVLLLLLRARIYWVNVLYACLRVAASGEVRYTLIWLWHTQ